MERNRVNRLLVLVPALLALALSVSPATAWAEDDEDPIQKVVIGLQGTSVDAEGERDGRFNRYQDVPSGFVVDYFRLAQLFGDGANYVDFQAVDALQRDERYRLRLGVGDHWRMRYRFDSTPLVFGNRGRTLLGRELPDVYRIGDLVQRQLEDPDGNGVPFFSEPDGPGGDNALVQQFTNDLFTGTTPFDLDHKRRTHDLDLGYVFSSAWRVGFDYQRHESRGTQPLGSGSYQRITDVDGDGATDYDYFFSIRGQELPATVEYDTVNTGLWAQYQHERWFGDVRYTFSEYENDNPFLLYDNPFWFNGVEATSGSRRGLWEEGRASLPPSNDAWNLSLTGGVNLGGNTRVTASVVTGEHSQNDPFAAITTNPALIATRDLNGDGVVDARDDPTSTALLPQANLDATSDISILDLRLTSRPVEWVRVNASWRTYEYDGGSSSLVIPARTEYIESQLKTDFKGTTLAFVPHFFERQNLKIEGVFDVSDEFRVVAFWKRQSYDWNRYQSFDEGDSREAGNRAVENTDDDTLGLKLFWDGPEWLDARFEYASSSREFSGEHRIGFAGELEDVRQFDIANRDRDAYELRLDFYPRDGVIVGFEAREWSDDYPDTIYGFLEGSAAGWTVDASFEINDRSSLYLYLDASDAETDMHLRTKCSNCAPPPGAEWTAPWGVPNYDWFPNYRDEDMSFGGSFSYLSEDEANRFDLGFDYVDAEVRQVNSNPATPRDLSKPGTPPVQVALAFNFPDQTTTSTTAEAKYIRKLSDRTSIGVLYIYEDWDLDDFQLQQLQAYGANFLTVDDATRYTFLDAWYGTFEAHVGQAFVKLNF